jgi:hypothetical protein
MQQHGPACAGKLAAYLHPWLAVFCWRIWIWILLLRHRGTFFTGSIALWCLQKRDFPQIQTESVTQSLKDALQFIFKTKIIFWAMFLDLGSVFFGGIIALLPIFAQDILHVGADGFGLLRAAPAFGGLIMMLILVRYPPKSRPWQMMLIAVTGFAMHLVICCYQTAVFFHRSSHYYGGM